MLKRLRLVKPQLEGTQFGYEQKEGYIRVTDPWGQVFEVQPPAEGLPYDRGIKDIRLPVACGTAAAIGKFYEKMYMVRPASKCKAGLTFSSTSSLTSMLYENATPPYVPKAAAAIIHKRVSSTRTYLHMQALYCTCALTCQAADG